MQRRHIGAALREVRVHLGLSLRDVEALVPKDGDSRPLITSDGLSRLETGQRSNPTLVTLVALAVAYKVDVQIVTTGRVRIVQYRLAETIEVDGLP